MGRKPKVAPTIQAWFDTLAQEAGRVALERLRDVLHDDPLGMLFGPGPAPEREQRERPRARPAGRVSAPWQGRSPFEDACGVLGVSPQASRVVVDAAYRVLAAEAHPDKHPKFPATAAHDFRRFTEAREIIYKERGWKK